VNCYFTQAEVFNLGGNMSRAKDAYVYFIKCGEYYKIGYSKDAERRVKELDNRPYKVELIYVSALTPYAYKIEQKIHEWLEEYKINGEWYDLPRDMIDVVCNHIKFEVEWEAQQGEIYDKRL
jgi:predicted GIY-YIG superfamily endonuclease